MAFYKVDLEEYMYQSESSDELYGDWSSSSSWELRKVTKVHKNTYGDVSCMFDFAPGDTAFLVWVEYSTGNSFGYAYRGSSESVALFKDYPTAKRLADLIESDGSKDWSYSEVYKSPDGQEFTIYTPWLGYFESLEEVHVDEVVIS